MTARADSVVETGTRILDAAFELYAEHPFARIRLEEIARLADVTVPTIVRRYGGKAGVIVALVQRELALIAARRAARADDPIEVVVRDLTEHYERYGTIILKVYAEAPLIDGLPELAARGRSHHVAWCRETFADRIRGDAATRERRLALAIALCDATTWRILRYDGGLDPASVRAALQEQLARIVGS